MLTGDVQMQSCHDFFMKLSNNFEISKNLVCMQQLIKN